MLSNTVSIYYREVEKLTTSMLILARFCLVLAAMKDMNQSPRHTTRENNDHTVSSDSQDEEYDFM